MTPEQTLLDNHRPADADTDLAARRSNGSSHPALTALSAAQAGAAVQRLASANGRAVQALRQPAFRPTEARPGRGDLAGLAPAARTIVLDRAPTPARPPR